ncbi:inverted formin-2-like [Lampetra fluviatilis]
MWARLARVISLDDGGPESSCPTSSACNMESADPELCVRLLQFPSSRNYAGLRHRLAECDGAWVTAFLELRGLDLLLEALERFSRCGRALRLTDVCAQLECVGCVRAVLNSRRGLDYLVCGGERVRTLVQAMDTGSELVKRQVMELLSALCVYSSEGHKLAIDALQHYKVVKSQHYRFSLILNELKATDMAAYQATLLGVINALIIGASSLQARMLLRNEFIGLQFLEVLEKLR